LTSNPLYAVVPAAGVGKRMGSDIPKQYLTINDLPIIHYTLEILIDHPQIEQVVVVLSQEDDWFQGVAIAKHPKLNIVIGGAERADSVLCGLNSLAESGRVLVHDAARPCLTVDDLERLIAAQTPSTGAILASEVRDTMKRANQELCVDHTVARDKLFHALTPQLFDLALLRSALKAALAQNIEITDEASAMEWAGHPVKLVNGRSDNIKITRPEDLQLARLFLTQQQRIESKQ